MSSLPLPFPFTSLRLRFIPVSYSNAYHFSVKSNASLQSNAFRFLFNLILCHYLSLPQKCLEGGGPVQTNPYWVGQPLPPYCHRAARRKSTRSGLKWRVWSDLIWSPRSDLTWPHKTPLGEIFRPNLAPKIDQHQLKSRKNRCQDGVFFRHHFKIDFWSTWAPNLDPLIRQNVGFS